MVIAKRNKNSSYWIIGARVVIALFGYICLFNYQQLVNASCITFQGQVGECVKFEECRSAVVLSQAGVNLGLCSFEDGTVCCPDYSNVAELGSVPLSEDHSRYFQSTPSGHRTSGSNAKDTFENDPDFEHKKPGGSSYYGRRRIEDHKFEVPDSYNDDEDTYKPPQRSARPNYRDEEGNFLPPGLAKKKSWRDEQTVENDYSLERVTKKIPRGPHRRGPSMHSGGNQGSNNSRKRGETNTERTQHGGKRLPGNSYNNQNEYESNYDSKRTTTKHSNYGQGTYFSTAQPNYFGSGSGNNCAGNGNSYSGLNPTRRPPSPSNFNTNFYQESSSEGSSFPSSFPSYPQSGSRPGNERPNYPEGSDFGNSPPVTRPQRRKTISEQKCEEYSKQVMKNITSLPLTTIPDPVTISVAKCVTPQQLIVGGENTTLAEFPHMAAIGFRDRNKNQISWNCGGTLISELFVMTAGHCTSTSSGRPVKVRLGEYNLIRNDDGAHPADYGVVQVITHPEYRPPSKYNDIALLKLSRKVTFFKHIRPACLYSEATFSASKAIATGWGRMHYGGGTSAILQKVVLSILDNQICDRLYKTNVKTGVLSRGIVDSQMCAGELSGGKDTCQGDSGGPLSITSATCIHHIIGITSFGKSCALPNSSGVYTRVSYYVPWIESVVWPTSNN